MYKESDSKKIKEENKRLKLEIKKLEKLAYFDVLTGAYNRNWFTKNIKHYDKFYITMVDLNSLKEVNDHSGHAEGDKFIIKVVNKLKKYGIVVRYGGDEFLILTDNKDLYSKLNNLSTKDFCYGGVKISDYSNITEAISKADEILYANKKNR